MASVNFTKFLKGKMLSGLISSDYYTNSATAEDNGLVKMQLLSAGDGFPAFDNYGAAQEIEWFQQEVVFLNTVATEPTGEIDGGTNDFVSETQSGLIAKNYSFDDIIYVYDGTDTYYRFEIVQGGFIQQDTALEFDIDAGTDIVGFRLIFFKFDDPDRTETTGITYSFESVFSYTNDGTLTISNTQFTVG